MLFTSFLLVLLMHSCSPHSKMWISRLLLQSRAHGCSRRSPAAETLLLLVTMGHSLLNKSRGDCQIRHVTSMQHCFPHKSKKKKKSFPAQQKLYLASTSDKQDTTYLILMIHRGAMHHTAMAVSKLLCLAQGVSSSYLANILITSRISHTAAGDEMKLEVHIPPS